MRMSQTTDGAKTAAPSTAAVPKTAAPPERTLTVAWEDPMAAAQAGAAMSGIDYMRAVAAGTMPAPPIARLMGFEIEEIGEGRAVFAVTPGEQHYNPIGVAHGGLAATLLDSCMGCCIHTLLPKGRAYTTLEIKVNYVRALRSESGRVRAIGTVIHMGGQVATAEGRIVDDAGKLYAHGTTTCILLGARG
jgi:uncharacterized protein (TIGR00369 family)